MAIARTIPLESYRAARNAMQRAAAAAASERAAQEIAAGLDAAAAWISPKYFYDRLGSRLFEAITDLPEYYPTRTERAILDAHAAEIAAEIGSGATLIELGAGNCEKALRLIPALKPAQYVALDISADFLRDSLATVARAHPQLDTLAVGADISADFELPPSVQRERREFLFFGSSIGNFAPLEAHALLRRVREQIDGAGGLLIGIDLVKPRGYLEAAYDDSLGVTAAFNLNVLNHVNALLGSDFAVSDWRHVALFNSAESRIEMHLEARRSLVVHWADGERPFAKGERIHTESSYKYRVDDFKAALADAGFARTRAWTDSNRWFAVLHAACDA
jgi:dimethylhistidine N-methyltransferase